MNRRDGRGSSGRGRAHSSRVQTPDAKNGFSLIELLIVMGIMAFLTAAILAVLPRVANSAKIAATRATIKTVDEQLNDRINGFRRWINNQDQAAGANGVPGYVTLQGTTSSSYSIAVAKVLAVKQLFTAGFAQNYSELILPPWSGNTAFAVGALIHVTSGGNTLTFRATVAGTSSGSAPSWPSTPGQTIVDGGVTWQLIPVTANSNTESASCLYLVLTKQALFDTEPPSTADLKGLQLGDTDNDGLMEILDAWGHPLRYYRWPTRLTRPNAPSGSATGFVETAPSPLGLAMGGAVPRGPLASWGSKLAYSVGATIVPITPAQVTPYSLIYQCVGAGTSAAMEPSPWPTIVGQTVSDGSVTWQAVLDPLSVDPDDPLGLVYLASTTLITEPAETPNTWSNPLIVSSGPDELLGLYEPSDVTDLGTLAMPLSDSTDATTFLRSAMYDNLTNHQ